MSALYYVLCRGRTATWDPDGKSANSIIHKGLPFPFFLCYKETDCSSTTEPSIEGEIVSPSPVCNVSHWPTVDFYVWAEVSLCVTDVHRTSPLPGGSWRSKSRVATSTQRPHLALQPLPNWFTVATTRPTQVSRDEHSYPLRLS